MNKVSVLGVKIDDLSLDQATDLVEGWLGRGDDTKKYIIVTPNPEFLVVANSDPVFRKILNDADLAIPDGVGLKLSGRVQNTTPGVELMEKLCQLAAKKSLRVGFIGGRGGVAKEAAKRLVERYPGLKVVLAESGPEVDEKWKMDDRNLKLDKEVRNWNLDNQTSNLQSHNPVSNLQHPTSTVDLLFIGFGMVKQEKWIAANLDKLPVKVAMGVGGSFDYLCGRIPRAPLVIRKLGFEWLFRLIQEPWRFKRQLRLLKFIWLLLTASFLRPKAAKSPEE